MAEKEKSLADAKYQKLKASLPRGFARIVKERLKERGIDISETAVRRVARRDFDNEDIQFELLELVKEQKAKKEKVKSSDFDKELDNLL